MRFYNADGVIRSHVVDVPTVHTDPPPIPGLSAAVDVDADAVSGQLEMVTYGDGEVAAVWLHDDAGTHSVRLGFYEDGTWTTQDVPGAAAGNMMLAYEAGDSERIAFMRYTAADDAWTAPELIGDPGAFRPRLGTDESGRVLLTALKTSSRSPIWMRFE